MLKNVTMSRLNFKHYFSILISSSIYILQYVCWGGYNVLKREDLLPVYSMGRGKMKKIIILSLTLFALFLVWGCAPVEDVTPEEKEFFDEEAIAGQAISLGSPRDTRVTSCVEDAGGSTVRATRSGRTLTFTDRCSRTVATNYSCASSTVLRMARLQCESSEDCVTGRCISRCGNRVVDVGETCSSCAADVVCAEGQVCREGACVASCTDTDPNNDVAIQGTVAIAATGYSIADYCEFSSGGGRLYQVNCDANQALGVITFINDCPGFNDFCSDGICVLEICDDVDNDADGLIDEDCDDDDDYYCDGRMEVVGTPAVCPNGAGDCGDQLPLINPGAADICSNYDDDNCNGQIDEGCAPLECTSESVLVPLNFRQPLREVKPTITATDLPGLLTGSSVTNAFGTSNYQQELSFEAVNSSIMFGENDEDITSYFFLMKNARPIALYKILFSEQFQTDIVGSNLEDFVGVSMEILGDMYTISEATRHSPNNISLTFSGTNSTMILADIDMTARGRYWASGIGWVYYDGLLTLNEEVVDGVRVIIEGTDDGGTIFINKVMLNMTAEDDYYVGLGQLLSNVITAAGDERELLFTNNWDIRFNEFNAATNSGTLEIGKICPTYPPVCIDYDAGAANPELVPGGALGLGYAWEYNAWSMQLRGDRCETNPVRVFERECSLDPSDHRAYGRMIVCPAGTRCVNENSCG